MPKAKEMLKSLAKRSDEHEFYSAMPNGYKTGETKYIVITGSVISGVGKGTFSSSLGNLMKMLYGFRVSPVKFDGYLNYDAGTLNPFRHGEVFVLEDGAETDLDLGTYERLLNQNLSWKNYLTAGKIFKTIIDNERAGHYLGRDVQFIPHVTGEIKRFMRELAMKDDSDIVLIEVGGTVGDIENSYFLEAMRELAYEEGKENVCFINVVYILEPRSLGEQKSKAAQLGLKTLMGIGIQPDVVVCRAENPVSDNIREKISVYSNVPLERVIGSLNVKNIYGLPLALHNIGIDKEILNMLGLHKRPNGTSDFRKWEKLNKMIDGAEKEIRIGITGKYTNVHDSYMSIIKALEHTAPYYGARVKMEFIETTSMDCKNPEKHLKGLDGIIVPGGFGERGVEGKIACVRYARENKIPFLGLCYGFQMAVIEFARNVCGLEDANTTEIDDKTKNPVICILPEQEEIKGIGGSMRLGAYDLTVKDGTQAHRLYGKASARERFRHRYNVNTSYIEAIEKGGMRFSGMAPEKRIMQILELPGHPFFMASQFHPELSSKPLSPNPLFKGFVEACVKK